MKVAAIRIYWRSPADQMNLHGPFVDHGGYIYQIFHEGEKTNGGCDNSHNMDEVWNRVFKIALRKGFTHYITWGLNEPPKEIPH